MRKTIKLHWGLNLVDIHELTLKFVWKGKEARIAKTIQKTSIWWDESVYSISTYYIVIVIKAV